MADSVVKDPELEDPDPDPDPEERFEWEDPPLEGLSSQGRNLYHPGVDDVRAQEIKEELERLAPGSLQRGQWQEKWSTRIKARVIEQWKVGKLPACAHSPRHSPVGFWSCHGGYRWRIRANLPILPNYLPNYLEREEETKRKVRDFCLKEQDIQPTFLGDLGLLPPEIREVMVGFLNLRDMGNLGLSSRSMYMFLSYHSSAWETQAHRARRELLS